MARSLDALAPVPRKWIDTISPVLRAALGGLFVAYSSYATVFLMADDLNRFMDDRVSLGLVADRYWIGLCAAVVFFLGEIASAERYPRTYVFFIVPDTIYTTRQLYPTLAGVFRVLFTDVGATVLVCALLGLLVFLTVYAAYWRKAPWLALWLVASVVDIGLVALDRPSYAAIAAAGTYALFFGYIVARFGEALIFGQRRKITAAKAAT